MPLTNVGNAPVVYILKEPTGYSGTPIMHTCTGNELQSIDWNKAKWFAHYIESELLWTILVIDVNQCCY